MEVDLEDTFLEGPLQRAGWRESHPDSSKSLRGYLWWIVPLLDMACLISPKILSLWLGTARWHVEVVYGLLRTLDTGSLGSWPSTMTTC